MANTTIPVELSSTPGIVDNSNATAITIDSSENVGIGTSSPSVNTEIRGSASNGQLRLGGSTTATYANIYSDNDGVLILGADAGNNAASSYFGVEVDGTERLRIDSSGNVGIGNTVASTINSQSGYADLVVGTGSGENGTTIYSGSNGVLAFANGTSGTSTYKGFMIYAHGDNTMRFGTDATERLRINSDGDLLVGTTESVSTSSSQVGGEIRSNGIAVSAVNSNPCTIANRIGTDGDITLLRKDGVTIGSIGTLNSDPWMARANGCGVRFITAAWLPATATGANSDNTVDLGYSGARFDDIYATNNVINTSDRNEKQDIEELSDAETAVAVACKGLLRKFRWKSAVEEKGDNARIHFGIIAQDLQDAFTAEGLDAGDYAMFISTTWWETQTEVAAVEAVEEVTDEEGNVTTEAVEAKDAYTRTDTYHTAEEAPEGATEKTRLGVRYSELLAFIIAAI